MANLKGWKNVLTGSQLEISVADANGATAEPFVAEADLVDEQGTVVRLSDAQLRPGPAIVPLTGTAPEFYDGRIWIQFAGAGTAVITVVLRKPNGTQHGRKAVFRIPGTANQRKRVHITILMK